MRIKSIQKPNGLCKQLFELFDGLSTVCLTNAEGLRNCNRMDVFISSEVFGDATSLVGMFVSFLYD